MYFSRTLFVSDIHLCSSKPENTDFFLNFLKKEAMFCDAIYILGDLFDFWIGDDYDIALQKTISNTLLSIKKKGIFCYFIHGNRDFLLSNNFALKSGMIFLPQECVINLYGKKILILHGDTFCKNDVKYQFFRKKTRYIWLQKIFLSLPLFVRKLIVNYIKKKSKQKNKNFNLIDINLKTIINAINKYHIECIIHGHTHKISSDQIKSNTLAVQCISLGYWNNKRGFFAEVTINNIQLNVFNL